VKNFRTKPEHISEKDRCENCHYFFRNDFDFQACLRDFQKQLKRNPTNGAANLDQLRNHLTN